MNFYVWEPVLAAYGLSYTDALLTKRSVFPIYHPFWNYPDATNYNPPGTGSTYPTPAGDSILGVVQSVANWRAHHLANVRGKDFDAAPGYLCIHNAGYPNQTNPGLNNGDNETYGLWRHPDDIVAGLPTTSPFQAYLTPYRQGGIDYWATAMTEFFEGLDSEAVTNLGFMDNDIEGASSFDASYMLPSGTAGNWYTPFLADARYSTEIAFDGLAFDDAFAPQDATDDPISWNTSQSIYHSSNNSPRSWLVQSFSQKIFANTIKRAFADPAKNTFPSIKVGNYEIQHLEPISGQPCHIDLPTLVDRTTALADLDVSSIVCYELYKFYFRLDNQANFEADVALWLTAMELESTGDVERDICLISRVRAKRLMSMAAISGKPFHWWARPREYETTLMSAFGYQWRYSEDDWIDIAMHAKAMESIVPVDGILWNGTTPITSEAHNLWVRMVDAVEGAGRSRITGRITKSRIMSGKITRK